MYMKRNTTFEIFVKMNNVGWQHICTPPTTRNQPFITARHKPVTIKIFINALERVTKLYITFHVPNQINCY